MIRFGMATDSAFYALRKCLEEKAILIVVLARKMFSNIGPR
jgi:hypothetical protein